jgi:signal transduction histidine kinase
LIVRVFYNLIDNAVRYGCKISTIRFSVQESGDDRIFVCEDNGVGIPTEDKKIIFDRGFGTKSETSLAISREILAITGITIKETGEPGKGARFEMIVPQGMYR